MFQRDRLTRGLGVLLAGLCLAFSASVARAEKWGPVTPKTKLKIGDRVQVAMFREWREGRITEFLSMGMVRVEVRNPRHPDFPIPHLARLGELRVLLDKPAKSRARKSTDTSNPFDPDGDFRTWQDNTGKHKIEAKLLGVADGAVRLERRDGREVRVPLDRLSDDDRRFVDGLQTGEPPAEEELQRGEELEADEEPSAAGDDSADELQMKTADWSTTRKVAWPFTDLKPAVSPDGVPAGSELGNASMVLPIEGTRSGRLERFWTAARSPHRIMIAFGEPFAGDKPQPVWLCDFAPPAPPKTTSLAFPPGMAVADIDPEGNQILTSCKGGLRVGGLLGSSSPGTGRSNRTRSGNMPEESLLSRIRSMGDIHRELSARVDLWRVTQGKLEHQFGWSPTASARFGEMGGMQAPWAAFVDAQHVLTCGEGKLTLWELPAARAVYSAMVSRRTPPALSPGHKYVAVLATTDEVFVLDALTGDVKGCYRGADCDGRLAFRPDGKQIALADSNRLLVWKLDSSELYRDIGLVGQATGSEPPLWVSDRHVLVGNEYLVDVETYLTVWDYAPLVSGVMGSIGGRPWAMSESGHGHELGPLELPHDEAEKRARELVQDDMLAIRPGDTVTLEVNCDVPGVDCDQISRLIERRLEAHDLKLAPNRPLKFVVDIKLGKTRTIEYRGHNWPTLSPPSPTSTDPQAMMEELRKRSEAAQAEARERLSDPKKPLGALTTTEVKETVTARERSVVMRFVVHDKTAWMWQRVLSPPLAITTSEGETAEQAVARNLQIDLEWFRHASLPRCVTWPEAFLAGKRPK